MVDNDVQGLVLIQRGGVIKKVRVGVRIVAFGVGSQEINVSVF